MKINRSGAAPAEPVEEENLNDPENNADPENNDPELVAPEESDPQIDPETGEPIEPEVDPETGEPVQKGEEDPDPEVDPLEARIAALEKENAELKKPKEEKPAAPQVKEPTPEEKEAFRERNGITYDYNESVKTTIGALFQGFMEEVKGMLGESTQGTALESFSKKQGFEDAMTYKDGIMKFLKENVSASRRNDPKFIEDAYWVAVGQAAKGKMRKIMNNTERNRRVVTGKGTVLRSAGPANRNAGAAVQLTSIEKDTARRYDMTEKEYAAFKAQGNKSKRR